MLTHLRPAVVLLLLFTVLTGLAYPLAMTGAAQLVLPYQANGSLVVKDGKVVGSELIGQVFASDRYFHGRPSATTAPDPNDESKTIDAPYNASSSAGSNLGPTSKKLLDRIAGDAAALKASAPKSTGTGKVPADSVTTSASGLDPHVSPAYAELQVARVAAARGFAPDRVRKLVNAMVERPLFGVLGEPRVNVLRLNLALDQLRPELAG